MANTPQSKKRARQTERRTEVNKARRSRIRTYLRKVEEAIASGDGAAHELRGVVPRPVLCHAASPRTARLRNCTALIT